MRVLFIDCGMGAAGDMLTAALLELLPDPDGFVTKLNTLGIPGVEFKKEPAVKCGITGTHMSITVHGKEEDGHTHHDHEQQHPDHDHGHSYGHHHYHRGLHDIEHIVRDHLSLPGKVREDVMEVYTLIAQAESHVHGTPVPDIHFHEVGTMDAIADITAVCLAMHELAVKEVIVSPIHVGSGQVRCAHGILPVPAPATAHILKDVPIYGGEIKGELCTPTGAALLKHFATRFGDMPVMKTQAIGYGMGKKDFPRANCVRAMLGETADRTAKVLEDDIHTLSRELELPTWDKQSFACLSSRFVYGETITEEKLSMVDKAEQRLLDLGFRQVRVRIHGNIARIEIGRGQFEKIIQPEISSQLDQYFHELGFLYVTLDLGGYQMGSMNKTLDI